MNRTRTLCVVAGLVAGGAALGYLAGFGPLDPPAGPVAETSPSLAELDAKLDTVLANQDGDPTRGPWQIFRAPATGTISTDQLSSTLVAPGRVFVRSVTVYDLSATLFDGPGTLAANRSTLTPNWIARGEGNRVGDSSNNAERTYFQSVTVEVDTIVENGLHAAWARLPGSSSGNIMIRYRQLEEQP